MVSAANAAKLEVNQMTPQEDYNYKFILEAQQPSAGHIELDCQSFIHKADFFNQEGKILSENFISINECEYLYEQTYNCLKKNEVKCIDSDYLFREGCGCD